MVEKSPKDNSSKADEQKAVPLETRKRRLRQLLLRTILAMTLAGAPAAIRLREVPGVVIDALLHHKLSDPLQRGQVNADVQKILDQNFDPSTAALLLTAADRFEAGKLSPRDLARLAVDSMAAGWGAQLDNTGLVANWMAVDQAQQQEQSNILELKKILTTVEFKESPVQPAPFLDQDITEKGEAFWNSQAAQLQVRPETLKRTVQTLKNIWRNNLSIDDVKYFIDTTLNKTAITDAHQRDILVSALAVAAEKLSEKNITDPTQIATIAQNIFWPLLPALSEVTPQDAQQEHDFLAKVFNMYGNKNFIPTLRDFENQFHFELGKSDQVFPYQEMKFSEYDAIMAELDPSTAAFSTTPEHQPKIGPQSFSAVLAFQYAQKEGQPMKGPIHLIIQRAVDGNYDYIASDPSYLEQVEFRKNKLIGFTDEGKAIVFSIAEAIQQFPNEDSAQKSMTKYLVSRKIRSAYVPNGLYDAATKSWTGFQERLDQYLSTLLVVARDGSAYVIHMQKTERAQGKQLTPQEVEEQFFDQLSARGISRQNVLFIAQGEYQFSVVMNLNGIEDILSSSPRDAYYFNANFKSEQQAPK